MILRAGFIALATRLQEASNMMHSEVASKLRDAVNDAHRGTGKWGNYIDHSGDGESGDCIYSCDGDIRKAPYSIGSVGGKSTTNIDMENSKNVVPHVSYDEEADDDDHYSAMESQKLYARGAGRLIERFISKGERDKADAASFAGKNRSFPILKPADVGAAVHAMGRAGSDNYGMAQLKANIIRIAKAKGWTSELPKAWQTGSSDDEHKTEAARVAAGGALKLLESITWGEGEALKLIESAGAVEREIKIIAPGEGSSAIYTPEVLKRDGPGVFTKGTQMFINHATEAERRERPEGDWHKLVGALSSDAYYLESHKDGEGLYAKARFAEGVAPDILAKAKLGAGLSISANGVAQTEAGRAVMKNGKPVLGKFTNCESIDIVTKAGAGGMIPLNESARRAANPNLEDGMSEDEKKRLFEAARKVELYEARSICAAAIADTSLIEAGKSRAIDNVLRQPLPMKDGVLDTAKLQEAIKAEAKREGEYLAALLGGGRVVGMGAAPVAPVQLTEKEEKKLRKEAKRLQEAHVDIFAGIMGDPQAAKLAAKGRAA